MNLSSSKQKQAVYFLITYVMMSSGRITSNKGNYWKKIATFININDAEKSSAMSSGINHSLTIINGLSEENRARVFAMVINMAFADGTVQENVATLLKQIAFALQIPPILEKMAQKGTNLSKNYMLCSRVSIEIGALKTIYF